MGDDTGSSPPAPGPEGGLTAGLFADWRERRAGVVMRLWKAGRRLSELAHWGGSEYDWVNTQGGLVGAACAAGDLEQERAAFFPDFGLEEDGDEFLRRVWACAVAFAKRFSAIAPDDEPEGCEAACSALYREVVELAGPPKGQRFPML